MPVPPVFKTADGAIAAPRLSRVFTGEFWLWSAVVGVAVILLGVFAFLLRRYALGNSGRAEDHDVMAGIDQLRRDGILSEQEYRRARRKALGLPPVKEGEPEAPPKEPPRP